MNHCTTDATEARQTHWRIRRRIYDEFMAGRPMSYLAASWPRRNNIVEEILRLEMTRREKARK